MSAELKENIYWVGFIDWNVRDFHGYETDKGSTYNAYLIKDEKTVLVDSVKSQYCNDLIRKVEKYTSLDKIDYIVCNHAEPDHSGSLPRLVELMPHVEIICNAKCQSFLQMHYGAENWKFKIVDEGESISIGKRSMTFINTPMAHWPDSMMTYIPEEKLVFTMDVFGQHFASAGRFDDEESFHDIMYEAKKYYANIILPLGPAVVKTLTKASTIDIEMIAPSHGVIFRKHIGEMVEAYKKWANHVPNKKVIIFYDSMWKSTDYMARAICEGASQVAGVEIKLYDIKHVHITELATEIIDAAAFAAGSPTLNSNLMPKMAEALTYLQGLAPQNKLAFAFGSYGWAKKGGAYAVQTYLKNMKDIKLLIEEPFQTQFTPDQDALNKLQALGKQLAEHASSVGVN